MGQALMLYGGYHADGILRDDARDAQRTTLFDEYAIRLA